MGVPHSRQRHVLRMLRTGTTALTPARRLALKEELEAQASPRLPAASSTRRPAAHRRPYRFHPANSGAVFPPEVCAALRSRGIGPDTVLKTLSEAPRAHGSWVAISFRNTRRTLRRTHPSLLDDRIRSALSSTTLALMRKMFDKTG